MQSRVSLCLLAAGLGLMLTVGIGPDAAVVAGPLAQATSTATATPTNTPTLTPTMPPPVDYGNGWLVQPLPRANMNCVFDPSGQRGEAFACVAGTAVVP